MSRKRSAPHGDALISTSSTTPEASNGHDVWKSEPILDRRSTFIAAFSWKASSGAELQALPEFSDAMHRVVAWRSASKQQTLTPSMKNICTAGHDDDGEAHAGKHLERVLHAMNVEGCVVVARWYGGVLLGPVRFTHIEMCAREAISRAQKAHQAKGKQEAKKVKMDDETKARLAQVLIQRDQSILVLRDLLAGKNTSSTATASSEPKSSAPLRDANVLPKYHELPADTLRRLEEARDKTIAFLLKQIDKAEATAIVPSRLGQNDNYVANKNLTQYDASGVAAGETTRSLERAQTAEAADQKDSEKKNP